MLIADILILFVYCRRFPYPFIDHGTGKILSRIVFPGRGFVTAVHLFLLTYKTEYYDMNV